MTDHPAPPQFEPFVPRRFLRNAHAMTLAGNFLPRANLLPEPEQQLFDVEEDIQVMCHCHWQPSPEKHATVIILHGRERSRPSLFLYTTPHQRSSRGSI